MKLLSSIVEVLQQITFTRCLSTSIFDSEKTFEYRYGIAHIDKDKDPF